jgi:alpha-galactosidase
MPGRVIPQEGSSDIKHLSIKLRTAGDLTRAELVNEGSAPVKIKEVVLFSLPHSFPPETRLYGEGFTMLSVTCGTLAKPEPLSPYRDAVHYKLPEPAGAKTYYGLLMLSPPREQRMLMAFTSCHRFSGKFNVRADSIEVVVDADGVELAPGEHWQLEEVLIARGDNRDELLGRLARRIVENHPARFPAKPPTGWCSWYMEAGANDIVGTNVTAEQVKRNLEFIETTLPGLRYLQIDEGYQAYDGDWLDTGSAFGGGVQEVLRTIRKQGFQPAIWVAPFIAEEKSRLLREHPDWFIQDDSGKPLRSDKVTFGGWHGPWYALDGTHPGAQTYLETVFRTMREQWGCQYFKLDANFWGAIQGGHHCNPKMTRVEAYRSGMEAVWRGAGNDAYILGCNHPLWPSFGLISGSRSSNDIGRKFEHFSEGAHETLTRNWQNGVLWWNDPDCVLLSGNLPESDYLFHAAAVLASGGSILSGDNLPDIPEARLNILRKLLPPTGLAAKFEDDDLKVGKIENGKETVVFLFNREDHPLSISFQLDVRYSLSDFWTGASLGVQQPGTATRVVPARSAEVLRVAAV